jgi:hypothetical protein
MKGLSAKSGFSCLAKYNSPFSMLLGVSMGHGCSLIKVNYRFNYGDMDRLSIGSSINYRICLHVNEVEMLGQ